LTNNSDVDLVMQHLKESGLKVLRVWGFNDVTSTPSSGTVYFQSFAGSEPTINTGANGLERLDYVRELPMLDCIQMLMSDCRSGREEC
jgi:mannan endo-1,4-beta-mannosidase